MTNSDDQIDPTEAALSQELLNLAWDLSEGLISEAGQVRLNELLLVSAANRTAYAEFMQLIALMEHAREQSTESDANDFRWIFEVDASKTDMNRQKHSDVFPWSIRRRSPSSHTSPAAAAVACAAVCILLATSSVFWFVPRPGQTVARSAKDTSIAKTDVQHPLIRREGDELSPENDPLFQKQLEELVQMSSGGP